MISISNKVAHSKSPLKSAPLRNPGQSVEEAIKRVMDDTEPYFFAAGSILLFTLLEWWQWYADSPPQPLVFAIVTGIVFAVTGRKVILARRQIRQLKQARDGERAVGQYLDSLQDRGYSIIHDVVGDGFNVDHVIVGPAGVFTIETKTISKPIRGAAQVIYDGKTLTVGGFKPDRDPITQGRAQARWLRELLQESTGRSLRIQSLVLYPGWFVRTTSNVTRNGVLVFNPKQVPDFLSKCPNLLSAEDVKLIAFHLRRYVRASARKDRVS